MAAASCPPRDPWLGPLARLRLEPGDRALVAAGRAGPASASRCIDPGARDGRCWRCPLRGDLGLRRSSRARSSTRRSSHARDGRRGPAPAPAAATGRTCCTSAPTASRRVVLARSPDPVDLARRRRGRGGRRRPRLTPRVRASGSRVRSAGASPSSAGSIMGVAVAGRGAARRAPSTSAPPAASSWPARGWTSRRSRGPGPSASRASSAAASSAGSCSSSRSPTCASGRRCTPLTPFAVLALDGYGRRPIPSSAWDLLVGRRRRGPRRWACCPRRGWRSSAATRADAAASRTGRRTRCASRPATAPAGRPAGRPGGSGAAARRHATSRRATWRLGATAETPAARRLVPLADLERLG